MNLNRFNLIIESLISKDITPKQAEKLINKFVVKDKQK